MKRIISFIALALVAALALAACGGSTSSSGSGGSSDFNKADVTFTQSMIPHHRQAVQMAKMATMHASTPGVKNLADKVEAAQGPEIKTMTGWLTDWGKKVPSDSESGMSGTGGMSMPGMMSNADMKRLGTATGAGFDRMFLTMMISHHTGAVEMAKSEQTDGKNADAVALAKKIEADQTAEITQMKRLLKS